MSAPSTPASPADPAGLPLPGGRLRRPPAPEAWRLVRSLDVDGRLAPYDVRVSGAHARALAGAGLLTAEELTRLLAALEEIAAEIAEGRFAFTDGDEDVHMAIERALTERLGDTGAKLHAGRSRNDQVVADLRLFVRDACADVGAGIRRLVEALVRQAESHRDAVMPGYTHLQRAQPVLLSHHLLAHAWPLVRDADRVARASETADVSPLGAGALAGTTLPLAYDTIAAELGFGSAFRNSIDAVADRDFALEFLAAAAITAVHLSRLAEEVVLWVTEEFGFAELDEAHATGSSIMPHKRNPDPAELVRAKAATILGGLVSLAATMKGLPLAYLRDLQEDKRPVFEAADALTAALPALAGTVETLRFREDRLAAAAADPALAAADVAEHLAAGGVPFRVAHARVGRALAEGPAGWTDLGPLPDLSPRASVERRSWPGSTGPGSVGAQLQALQAWLAGEPLAEDGGAR